MSAAPNKLLSGREIEIVRHDHDAVAANDHGWTSESSDDRNAKPEPPSRGFGYHSTLAGFGGAVLPAGIT